MAVTLLYAVGAALPNPEMIHLSDLPDLAKGSNSYAFSVTLAQRRQFF